jgi:hypothetical protein
MSDNDKTNPGSTEQLSLSDAKTTAEIKQIESSIKREDRKLLLEVVKTVILVVGGLSAFITYIGKVFGGG